MLPIFCLFISLILILGIQCTTFTGLFYNYLPCNGEQQHLLKEHSSKHLAPNARIPATTQNTSQVFFVRAYYCTVIWLDRTINLNLLFEN
jgi:hypothetical protein